MFRSWPLALALLIVVGSGVAHGLCSGRWSASEKLQTAVDQLGQFPATIDDWEGKDLDDESLGKFRDDIPGALQRHYVQRGSGQEITVMLVCGRPGPIAVHTPEVCYQGAGWKMASDRTKQLVPLSAGEPAPFWKATFVKEGLGAREELRIYWSWNAGGSWQAVNEPRLAFARFPVLHKFYVVYRVPSGERQVSDPCPAFLRQVLPALNDSVFASR
jgi:Protein of unknown function (DUF3485)